MKSLYDLLVVLIREEASKLSIDAERDIKTLARRVEQEGQSFMTKVLPDFGKDTLVHIESGCLSTGAYSGFRKRSKNSRLPAFLQGWTRQLFDDEGNVLTSPSALHLASLRLICLFLSKVRFPCTPQQEYIAERKFVRTDDSLVADLSFDDRDLQLFELCGAIIINDITKGVTSHESLSQLAFHHGPGAVFNSGVRGSHKYRDLGCTWHSLLERFVPSAVHGIESYDVPRVCDPSEPLLCGDDVDRFPEAVLSAGDSGQQARNAADTRDPKFKDSYSRVVFVPKTCKGPRTIAVEGTANQFVQQGIKEMLYRSIESGSFTAGRINFADQDTNKYLARKSSLDKSLATVDLSDASDRVLTGLVSRLLRVNPFFHDLVMSCRSTHAVLPSGEIKQLNKFASMGSALCFPMEALVFYTILIAYMHRLHGVHKPSANTMKALGSKLFVYGDDLIVPSHALEGICATLHRFGLKVNKAKTFVNSHFRESCGGEYLRGIDVTPVYLREDPFAKYSDPKQLSSFFATVHQLYNRGNFETCEALRKAYEANRILPKLPSWARKQPSVPVNSGEIGWPTFSYVPNVSYDDARQVGYVKVCRLSPKKHKAIDGPHGLFRWFRETLNRELTSGRTDTNEGCPRSVLSAVRSITERDRDWRNEAYKHELVRLRTGRAVML